MIPVFTQWTIEEGAFIVNLQLDILSPLGEGEVFKNNAS